MKTWIACVAIVLACGIASAAFARPSTPPPATGIITPLTGDRDSAPSASPATDPAAGCQANPVGSVMMMNGAVVPAPATTTATGVRSAVVINGAAVPGAAPAPGAESCGGAYSESAGTNFGSAH